MKPEEIKLFWITEGGENHAPTRHRALIYSPILKKMNIVHYYGYSKYSYSTVRKKIKQKLLKVSHNETIVRLLSSLLTEIGRIGTPYYLVRFFLIPFLRVNRIIYLRCFPSWPHRIMIKIFRKKVYFDFDDALFLQRPAKNINEECREGQRNEPMARQIGDFLIRCDGAIVSNQYLADWSSRFCKNICIIPTSVEIKEKYLAAYAPEQPIILGWIGAPENQKYLSAVFPAIKRVLDEFPQIMLHIISSHFWEFPHTRIQRISWDIQTYQAEIKKFSMGLAPLDDTLWTRGKMQFKAIQCAAQGVPVVASPVGFDLLHWKNDENILLARQIDEYYTQIRRLIDNIDLRIKIGRAGLETVRRYYDANANARLLLNKLCDSTSTS